MLRFRPRLRDSAAVPATDLLAISGVIDDALLPGQFFAAPDLKLEWIAARSETIPWEIFRGRLMDETQTREKRSFLSWHLVQNDEPMVSVKFDVRAGQIHVTRGFGCHVWEGYDAGGGVIESREAVRWMRELVGTMVLDRFADLDAMRDELICLLWQAVVGTSRLPLTSVEAPLPAFVLGSLHYLAADAPGEHAITSWEDWLARGLRTPIAWRETVKLLEFTLRHIPSADLPRLTHAVLAAPPMNLTRLLRSLFNDVSLSPYTGFVANTLAWVDLLTERNALSAEDRIDFLGHLLRQLGRHLTAYDLVTFHHRGANYPDALLLDAVLNAYLQALERQPDRFAQVDASGRSRRRALRQGVLLRRHYEGHFVPDAPTSPGENARVMPASHPRVPEDQLTSPHRRRRQLFADQPVTGLLSEQAKRVFAQSLGDLEQVGERSELGIGIFIDRPLGYAKAIAEPDLTPLLAHEAFSGSLARRRLLELQRLSGELGITHIETLTAQFEQGPWPGGLPHAELAECPRPTAALTDVRRVADDFAILRTLPGGLADLLACFDWRPLQKRFRLRFLADGQVRWCLQAKGEQKQPVLLLADEAGRRRLEMRVDGSRGYACRAGVEVPIAGLQVTAVWEDADGELTRQDLADAPCSVPSVQDTDGLPE